MTLEQFSFELWRRWIGAKERGQHRVGELRLGDGADLVPADGHDGTVARKEHGIVIARMHGRNHGEEPLNILRVETAGSHAVIFEAIASRASSALTLRSNRTVRSLVSGDRMISSGSVSRCSR